MGGKHPDQGQQRKAVREAKAEGKKPSEADATTGASKQREHVAHSDDRHAITRED